MTQRGFSLIDDNVKDLLENLEDTKASLNDKLNEECQSLRNNLLVGKLYTKLS